MRGFVPTPESLVDHMVRLLFDGRAIDSEDRLLDPGCGTGAFIKGVQRWGSITRSRLPQMTGIEIEGKLALEAASHFQDNTRVNVIQEDFLRYEPSRRFRYIIGNPPYVCLDSRIE